MGKKIAWTDEAKANLRTIDQATAIRILHVVARYLATGEGDVKRLQDVEPPELRLRVGDYRVRFHDLGDSILVLAIKHRRRRRAFDSPPAGHLGLAGHPEPGRQAP